MRITAGDIDGKGKTEMEPVIPIRQGRLEWTQERLLEQLEQWRRSLQEDHRSPGTVKKYVEAVADFLGWYEREEGTPVQIETLTPIALIGYRTLDLSSVLLVAGQVTVIAHRPHIVA
jgi:hypothetical protein